MLWFSQGGGWWCLVKGWNSVILEVFSSLNDSGILSEHGASCWLWSTLLACDQDLALKEREAHNGLRQNSSFSLRNQIIQQDPHLHGKAPQFCEMETQPKSL